MIGRSYDEERQNFANWFTYYRRREFVAKNALANVITSLSQVRVGIYGINKKVVQPLADVKVTQGLTVSDSTNTLLGLALSLHIRRGHPTESRA